LSPFATIRVEPSCLPCTPIDPELLRLSSVPLIVAESSIGESLLIVMSTPTALPTVRNVA